MATFDVSKLNIPFMKYRRRAIVFSIALIVLSLACLSIFGLNYSVDFSGGVSLQLKFASAVDIGAVRESIKDVGRGGQDAQAFEDGSIRIRYPESDDAIQNQILQILRDKFGEVSIQQVDKVGPVVGKELRGQSASAIILAIVAILVYMAFRFRLRFGVAAVLALAHDSLIMLGAYSLTGREVGTPFIAAVLTVIGYSLNDTIVILDRVRENWGQVRRIGVLELINNSVNQTLSRTLNTALTTLLPALAMFFLGGEVISNLAFAFLVGIVVGTYSSIYVASSIVAEWYLRKPD